MEHFIRHAPGFVVGSFVTFFVLWIMKPKCEEKK